MSFSVSNLRNKRRTIAFTYFDEKGDITYNPGAITDDMIREISEAGDEDDLDRRPNDAFIAQVVLAWDVAGDDGDMLPITAPDGSPSPEMRKLPSAFKNAVVAAIIQDIQGNSTPSAATSAGTSRRRGR